MEIGSGPPPNSVDEILESLTQRHRWMEPQLCPVIKQKRKQKIGRFSQVPQWCGPAGWAHGTSVLCRVSIRLSFSGTCEDRTILGSQPSFVWEAACIRQILLPSHSGPPGPLLGLLLYLEGALPYRDQGVGSELPLSCCHLFSQLAGGRHCEMSPRVRQPGP